MALHYYIAFPFHYIAPHCFALPCPTLPEHIIAWRCIITLHSLSIALHHIALHYLALPYLSIPLHGVALLHCIPFPLHCTTLLCITLPYLT